jgi:exosome complex component RRP43
MTAETAAGGAAGSPTQLAQSFPAPLFAVLDPPAYLNAHLTSPVTTSQGSTSAVLRPSGRKLTESCTPSIHAKAPLANAAGSAVVRVGDAACVAGVRIELLDVKDCPDLPREFLEAQQLETERSAEEELGDEKDEVVTEALMPKPIDTAKLAKHLRLLVPNVELATGSSPQSLPGQAPSTLAQSTASQLLGLMHSLPVLDDHSQLIVREQDSKGRKGKVIAFWVLYIDVTMLSIAAHSAASLLSTILPCILGALKGVRLPSVRRDDSIDGLVCDSRRELFSSLKVNERNPAVVAFHVFEPTRHKGLNSIPAQDEQKSYILADADSMEGDLCPEEIMVIVEGGQGRKKQARLRKVVKVGGSAATLQDMKAVFALAEERWKVWDKLLTNLDTEP